MLEVATICIFVGVRIVKDMPGSVASGTHCVFVTSGGVNEVRALLAIYAAYNTSFLPAFRANLSVPSSRVEQSA
jgi:hypothetical protein